MSETGEPDATGPAAAAEAAEAVEALRSLARQLSAAAGAERSVTSDDGAVTVVAAAGRLRSIRVAPRVFERLDHRALVTALTGTVQQALVPADGRSTAGPPQLPGSHAPDPRKVEAFAAQTFAGAAADGSVTAAVRGTGELTHLDVAVTGTRGEEQASLGERVVAAVNAAVEARAQARAAEFGLTSPVGELRKQTDAFVSRMANVEAQMSQVREQLGARLAEVQQLRRRPGA